jgi:hypothetical protein
MIYHLSIQLHLQSPYRGAGPGKGVGMGVIRGVFTSTQIPPLDGSSRAIMIYHCVGDIIEKE